MQITHYEIVNGSKSDKKEYNKEIKTSKDIKKHKDKLRGELNIADDQDILFHLQLTQMERLKVGGSVIAAL